MRISDRQKGQEGRGGQSRRAFLRTATGATVVAGAAAAGAGTAIAAESPGSPPRGRHIPRSRIGIQLYTVRDLMAQSVEDTLAFLARVGYTEVEPAGLFGYTPEQFGRLLQDLHLQAPSSHVGIPESKDAQKQVFEDARAIGQRWVTDPYFAGGSIDAYKRFAAHLNEAGALARRHGLRVAYHNHDAEFIPIDGQIPFYVLLEETDRRLVDFELDIYWAIAGGVDPVDVFRRAPGRIPLSHIKGMTAQETMTDVGEGVIDWGQIFANEPRSGIHHYFVERDDQPHPKETARDSYQYLRHLTF